MTEPATIELDAQYRQLREECGLLDRSARGKLLFSGPDAAEYLQGQLTNDVEALAPGEGCYAALLDRKGHMQADMRVLRLAAEEIWLDTEPEGLAAALRHLRMYSIGREVEIAELGAERAILSLIGPASAAVAGAPVPPELGCRTAAVVGVECVLAGTREGIDLIAAAGEAERLRGALLGAGAVEVAAEAAEILRVEAGVPRFGAEMGDRDDARRGRHRRGRRQLHQGLLHRPGDGRAPPLQGPPQPPPARPAAERAERAGGGAATRREGGGAGGQRLRLPRPGADRPGDRAP